MHSFLKSSLILSLLYYFIYENQKMEVIKSSCGENEKVGVKCWKWRRCCGFPSNIGTQKKLVITFFWCFSNSLFFQLHAAALSSQKFRLCEGNNATAVLPVFFQLFRGSLWLCVHVNCFHLLFKELVADRDFHCNKCHVYQKQLWPLENEIISSPFYRGIQMQNAKITWYAFHFLSLRLLIGILGQAFLAVLKISGYIGEKTNSRKRKGWSQGLDDIKGLIEKA